MLTLEAEVSGTKKEMELRCLNIGNKSGLNSEKQGVELCAIHEPGDKDILVCFLGVLVKFRSWPS